MLCDGKLREGSANLEVGIDLKANVSVQYATKQFNDLEVVVDRRISEWLQRISARVSTEHVTGSKFDIGRSVRYMTLDVAAHICFSHDLMFSEDEADEFWASMEENAPYAQYLSALHWLFALVYNLTKIPGLKRRMILTETNNPGIGRILRVWTTCL